MNTFKSLSECEVSKGLRSKIVYDFFASRSTAFGPVEIIKTPIAPSKRESDNSYSFSLSGNEERKQRIESIFEVDLSKIPNNKIDKRITTLHSSALAVLLCFHNISSNNPLEVKINDQTYKFTEFKLEFPNQCKKNGGRSKIDIALFNEDKSVVLFLEAKFSEYLESGCKKISEQYKDEPLFTSANILPDYLYLTGIEDQKPLQLLSKNRGQGRYREGIKQILCHCIGANHYIQKKKEKNVEIKNVFIGALLFDFGDVSKELFVDYCNMYSDLAKKINSWSDKEPELELVNKVITYQELFSSKNNENNSRILSSKVKCYYNLY